MSAIEPHGTAIEWTHAPGFKGETWNPVTGCDRVSPGCAHCYARTLAKRLKAMGQPRYQRDGDGPGFGVTLHPDLLDLPLRWRKPRQVFVNSMSDLFHEEIPDGFIAKVFNAMGGVHQQRHRFLVLTKRPERARAWFAKVARCEHGWRTHDGTNPAGAYEGTGEVLPDEWPLPNVWLGVSIENARYTWRADVLREIPAAVRFLSCEPLLGSLFETRIAKGRGPHGTDRLSHEPLDLTGIDWVIAGGESGPGARPMHADWARELRDACACPTCCADPDVDEDVRQPGRILVGVLAVIREPEPRAALQGSNTCPDCSGTGRRVAFFFKQWGGSTPKSGGRELDAREWNEMPEFAPAVAA